LRIFHYGSSGTYLPVERKCGVATVSFVEATRVYPGADHPSVDKLNLEIGDGEFMVLVGPSGCGKSTSLRMLAGLEEINAGAIHIGDRDVTDLPPKDRDIAMVFQNYALYPHMTVGDNMGFALKMAGVPKAERQQRVQEAAHLLGLEDYLNRKPKALSGGQRQRVAMGRAIVRSPQVFLMDEPLSNLDAKLRVSTRTQIAALQTRLGVTTVYVTHDQVEAMTMGDRVAVMKAGVLQQVDTPLALYDSPSNLFVAGFIGSPAMNLMEGPVAADGVHLGDYTVPVAREILAKAGNEKSLVLGIRPENFEMSNDPNVGIGLDIGVVEELGADAFIYGTLAGIPEDELITAQQITARIHGTTPPHRGETVRLKIDPSHVHVFSKESGERLSPTFGRGSYQ
jgi:multiple sugar transport system ATP-binding protein